ncbi:MAG: hypothetical protein ACTTKL_01500 [Treponema sp.]
MHLLEMRIISDEIKLPAGRTGFYACSEYGLALAIDRYRKDLQTAVNYASPC